MSDFFVWEAGMSGLYINQLERLKTAKGEELLTADRLEDGKIANVAPPPIPSDKRIKIERGDRAVTKVTVRES
ncbi:hypothetical protein X772_17040 [Mesorhizobium sp. LSJC280B00]|nr:hypothetical protein X772_17040 [Mesorhizobium sp. LSJC280B00]